MPAIRAEGLHKAFAAVTALHAVDLEVSRGQIFGFLGPNGAGKTTTLRLIVDLLRPDRGALEVLGTTPAAARGRVGYMPEERGLYQDLGVHECVTWFGRLRGLSRPDARARATRWLDRLGLAARAHSRVSELSGGTQQKVQLAVALVHEPELVILDEPFQGLDPLNVEVVRGIVREVAAEGRTVVLCAHEMSQVETLCERVALLAAGRVVLAGALEALRRAGSPDAYDVRPARDFAGWPEVARSEPIPGGVRAWLAPGASATALARRLAETGELEGFSRALYTLEQLFVNAVAAAR